MTRLEVCVDDAAGVGAAVAGGADRIELCSSLSVGGLTPSAGLMALAARGTLPAIALIRPHDRSFSYTGADEAVMHRDVELAAASGLAGVAIGALTSAGDLDRPLLERLARRAQGLGLELTLHRAFDLVHAPEEALETAIELGFARVLTSGGMPSAPAGSTRLAALIRQAQGRICVMPGGGVRPGNVIELLRTTGASDVHASCREPAPMPNPTWAAFGFSGPTHATTSERAVRELKRQISG